MQQSYFKDIFELSFDTSVLKQQFGGTRQSYFKGIFELSFNALVLQQQFGDMQQSYFKAIFELSFDTSVLMQGLAHAQKIVALVLRQFSLVCMHSHFKGKPSLIPLCP